MRVVHTSGDSTALGRAAGRAERDLIERAIALTCRLDVPDARIDAALAAAAASLASAFPEVLEEIDGLADGAEIDRRDALLLTLAGEVTGRQPGWCTLACVAGDDGPLVGKNLDTTPALREVQVVEHVARNGAIPFVHLTTAGARWTDGGINEAGLVLANASLAAASPDPAGVSDGVLARELLARCETVSEAIALTRAVAVRTNGENLLLADAHGRSALVAKLPGGYAVRHGAAPGATNHPHDPGLLPLMGAHDPIAANSRRRRDALAAIVAGRQRWTLGEVEQLLAGPAICQHGDAGLHTIAAFVADPRAGTLLVADGPPDSAPFVDVAAAPPTVTDPHDARACRPRHSLARGGSK